MSDSFYDDNNDVPDENFEEGVVDIDTSNAQEPTIVEPGEYKIRITGFRKDNDKKIIRTSDAGNRYFIVVFDIPAEEFSKSFTHLLSLPSEDMDAKRLNSVKWNLELFKRAFNLSEINFNSMIGKEGYALLKVTSSEDYGEQNAVAKFVAGA